MHLDLVPAVRMREVEDQHIAPPYSPKSRYAVYCGLFQPQCRIEVEQSCAERRFPNRHKVPFDQFRLHRVAGDAEGGEEEDLGESPNTGHNENNQKRIQQPIDDFF